MKIISVEPTPSPNTMMLNMDQSLPPGLKYNFTNENKEGAPDYIIKLLEIPGVKGVFQAAAFISIERNAKFDWQAILAAVKSLFGEGQQDFSNTLLQGEESGEIPVATDSFGEIEVYVQKFRNIPIQVKLLDGTQEIRFGLPERFKMAIMTAQSASPNMILERKWVEQGVRYGDPQDIGEEVVKEISAAYDEERLARLVKQAIQDEQGSEEPKEELTTAEISNLMDDPDWEKRFAALARMDPTSEELPILAKALEDSNLSMRRLATAYLGMIEDEAVLPYLYKALADKSPIIRRTAGDAISDLGNPAAIPAMVKALKDPNKLVRWRAARFLYEVGDESALPALEEAQEDPEFEIRLQVKMALVRIKSGEEASGTVWQQMARGRAEQDPK